MAFQNFNHLDTMPYGYRWLTTEELVEYCDADSHLWGWMRDEYLGIFQGRTVRQWDCMIEFGLDHDHDPEVCESILANMNPDYPDETDYSEWYGGEQGYNDGLRWSDFV